MANEAWLVSATRPNIALQTAGYYPNPPAGHPQPSGMFVELMNAPYFAEGIPEWAARVCYNSQHRFMTDGTYLLDRVREEHLDVLEHTVFTINCSSSAASLSEKFSVRSGPIYGNDTVTANMRVWWDAHQRNRLSNAVSRILAEQAPTLFKMTWGERVEIRPQVPPAANSGIHVPEARWGDGYHVALLGANLFEDEIAGQVQHCSASFYLGGGSRAMTHQLVRHRLKSFSMLSQRYTDFTKLGGELMVPPSIAGNPEASALYDETMQILAENYDKLRKMKIRKEDARYILPNAATTKIVVTAQFDSWLHFLWLRAADKAAQWEIREFAYQMGVMLERIAPGVFGPIMQVAREVREEMQGRLENV